MKFLLQNGVVEKIYARNALDRSSLKVLLDPFQGQTGRENREVPPLPLSRGLPYVGVHISISTPANPATPTF